MPASNSKEKQNDASLMKKKRKEKGELGKLETCSWEFTKLPTSKPRLPFQYILPKGSSSLSKHFISR